jgi:hypothetical protein
LLTVEFIVAAQLKDAFAMQLLDMNDPKNSTRMMWVLIITILSIAAARGELTAH